MAQLPLIAFEGPIAAGKTTLANRLAAHLGCDLILEEFEGN
ncbi:MAG: deoxynucleoside kinase, partial [Acidobacteriota bacterium]|nr:deoxynucleoside kinase [Acidobacteriota bacterium]